MIWTDQHSSNLRALLSSTPVIAKLNEHQPDLDGNTMEERAMAASERGGFELCIKELVQLSQQVSQPTASSPFIEGLEQFEQRAKPVEQ